MFILAITITVSHMPLETISNHLLKQLSHMTNLLTKIIIFTAFWDFQIKQ